MMKSRRTRESGIALFMVLGVMVAIFAALGAMLNSLATSARSVQTASAKAQAGSLALGAWSAAREGLAREGASFEGFSGKPLGAGSIDVVVENKGDGRLAIKAIGRVSGPGRGATQVLIAEALLDDSKPAGGRLISARVRRTP